MLCSFVSFMRYDICIYIYLLHLYACTYTCFQNHRPKTRIPVKKPSKENDEDDVMSLSNTTSTSSYKDDIKFSDFQCSKLVYYFE